MGAAGVLRAAAFEQLASVQQMKKKSVEDYFGTLRRQLRVLKDDPLVLEALGEMTAAFREGGGRVDTPGGGRLPGNTRSAFGGSFRISVGGTSS